MTSQKKEKKSSSSMKTCENCGVHDSPAWRRHSKKLLCNKCGLYAQRNKRDRPLTTSKTAKRSPKTQASLKKVKRLSNGCSSSAERSASAHNHEHSVNNYSTPIIHSQYSPQNYQHPPMNSYPQQMSPQAAAPRPPSPPMSVPPMVARKYLNKVRNFYADTASTSSSSYHTESTSSDHQISTPMSVVSNTSFSNGSGYFSNGAHQMPSVMEQRNHQHQGIPPMCESLSQYPSSASSMDSGSSFGSYYRSSPLVHRGPMFPSSNGVQRRGDHRQFLPYHNAPQQYNSTAMPPQDPRVSVHYLVNQEDRLPDVSQHVPPGRLPAPYTLSFDGLGQRIPLVTLVPEPQLSPEWSRANVERRQQWERSAQYQHYSSSGSELQNTPEKQQSQRQSSNSSPLSISQSRVLSSHKALPKGEERPSTTTSSLYARPLDATSSEGVNVR